MDGELNENESISQQASSKRKVEKTTCEKKTTLVVEDMSIVQKKDIGVKNEDSMAERVEKSASAVTYLQKISSLTKQKKTADALAICDEGLAAHPENTRLLEKKSKLLCQLHKFNEAFAFIKDWMSREPENDVARREYDNLKVVFRVFGDHDSDHTSDEEEEIPENETEEDSEERPSSADHGSNDSSPVNGHGTVREKTSSSDGEEQPHSSSIGITSHYSSSEDIVSRLTSSTREISFTEKDDLHHGERLFGDDSHKWQYRDPPRGLAIYEYTLCKRFMDTGRCPFGEKCTKAHSDHELIEWNHRIAERKQQLQQSDSRANGGTYIEQLLEKLMCQESPKMKVVDNLDFVKVHVNSDLKVNVSSKKSSHAWTFTVTSKLCLHCVALMMDSNRSYFNISSISVGPRKTQKYQNIEKQCQEWINQEAHSKGQGEFVYRVKVVFKTDIYGTFRQNIVFDFGFDAILMREVQVESAPATDPEKILKEITLTAAHRWNEKTVTLIPFEPRPVTHTDVERALMAKYTLPRADSKFCHPGRVGHPLGKHNYRLWMHEMLYVEEMAQLGYISRFNVTTSLNLQNQFVQLPGSRSTVRYAVDGELFARLKLADDLSEDSMAGKLILQSSDVAWIADGKKERPGKVYEAIIEDKCKNIIYMRLSSTCVRDLGLKCDQDFCAQIQFQLNRLPMCERHLAIDRLPTLDIVFPPLDSMPSSLDLDNVIIESGSNKKCLNEKQVDAVKMILASKECKIPPLLLVGPFGTGKTFTVAQAMLQVLKQEGTRILLCTHSNSAADIYINEFLHDFKEAQPLRVMQRFRWIETVPEKVLPFTLLEHEGTNAGTFRSPTEEDILAHKIIIVTLSSARIVVDLDLPKDTFTHIFIDEAGQSLECETIIPLGIATENTRIVFAGDHMQMSVEVYSDLARQQELHISLLERLHDYYPKECIYKVMLCENYRSHKAIVDFTSELFYDNKVISSGKIVAHEQFYPLTFFAAKGEEVQHDNSTGFYNMSEVYEIVERVDELKKKWPSAWGPFDRNGISIVAPYSDQVARIRSELKKRKLMNVNVERVMNVQGKQYRVLMISITRTRLTCRSDPSLEENGNFGFLSNMKLLNTAITRAQSLVVVVGDPVSVCLVGECRKIWEYFLEKCHFNNSLHGISWVPLREQLDRAELMKSFVLNPLAPEFVPKIRPPIVPLMMAPADYAVDPSVAHLAAASATHQALQAQAASSLQGQVLQQMYHPMYQTPIYWSYPHHVGAPLQYSGGVMYPGLQLPGAWKGHPLSQHNGKRLNMPLRGNPRAPRFRLHREARFPVDYGSPQMPPLGHPLHPQYAPALVTHQPLVQDNYLYHHDHVRPLAFPAQHPAVHPYLAASGAIPHLGGLTAGNPLMPLHHSYVQPAHVPPPSSVVPPNRDATNSNLATAKEKQEDADNTKVTRHTDSPTSGIQLLPNVKHVPVHLLNTTSGDKKQPSQNFTTVNVSSASGLESSVSQSSLARNKTGRVLSSRSYSPANYARERSSSGEASSPTGRSISPGILVRERAPLSTETATRSSQSPPAVSPNVRKQMIESEESSKETPVSQSQQTATPFISTSRTMQSAQQKVLVTGPTLNNRRKGPSLRLNTGFSRQYSDEMQTPSYIRNMIQMIDETTEETIAEERIMSTRTAIGEQSESCMQKRSVAQMMQQELSQKRSSDRSLSPTPSPSDKPSYASVLSKSPEPQPPLDAEGLLEFDIQTPQTPKGFMTPGVDVVDPLGILKSLNIGHLPQK